MTSSPIERYDREPSTFARRFFWLTLSVFSIGCAVARLLVLLTAGRTPSAWGHFPPAFCVSSVLLLIGSVALHRALQAVRIEKPASFRRALLVALGSGTLFVGIQSFGLWCLIQQQRPEDASTGVNAFMVMLAALHGLHFTVALMFLSYVTIKGFAARYDHEYFWGVQVCAWFWHALGLIWLAILGVFLITA
ncbi:MAG: cytochrome o ubiquinol oxidase subunit [Planctomycetaceae bacterium]|nr:cytochrome o ubiquinol oxidase subunit [Planctomycetaceae bacterium]